METYLKPTLYINVVKRTLDMLLSSVALVVFLPVLTVCFVIGYLIMGSPLYTEERAGCMNRPFRIYKLKTMNDKRNKDGHLLPDQERLTKYGKFLRKFSIDELPQLINVLLGQMSLIGPRPLSSSYLPLYSKEQIKRHCVKPGITGWAQINGRNLLTWEDKFSMDVWYVDHIDFLLDCKIFFMTIKKVLIREGTSSQTSVTMSPFKGNSS